MSTVAVAGGTGNLGRTIVEGLQATHKFNVIILARTSNKQLEEELGSTIVQVDYADVAALTSQLDEHNVHTVISTIDTMRGGNEPELNLIEAASKSASVKRHIPSAWDCPYTSREAAFFPAAEFKIAAFKALQATSLEYTRVLNGFLLDYYLIPHVNSHMTPLAVCVDVENNTAAIPGSGDVPIVFTYSHDVAKMVAALLSEETWEPESYIIGDKVTMNQLLHIIEEVKSVKFTVTTDSVNQLQKGKATELPSHPDLYPFFPKEHLQELVATFGLLFESGAFNLQPRQTLNHRFPHCKVKSVQELVAEAWGSRRD